MRYQVIYSKRKTVSLSVKGSELIVRAPIGTAKTYIESLIKKHTDWIENAIARQKKKSSLFEGLTEADVNRLKREARLYFSDKLKVYSAIMGLKYNRFSITSAKTRFGSCSSKGNICFSYRLMLYPERAREYVVVHELAHLVHMNHSKSFYDLIAKYLPDYKERKRLLK